MEWVLIFLKIQLCLEMLKLFLLWVFLIISKQNSVYDYRAEKVTWYTQCRWLNHGNYWIKKNVDSTVDGQRILLSFF